MCTLIDNNSITVAMEKSDVQKLIDCNSERVSCELSKGKSAVWMHFAHVMVDGMAVPFVKCVKCSSVPGLTHWAGQNQFNPGKMPTLTLKLILFSISVQKYHACSTCKWLNIANIVQELMYKNGNNQL